MTAVIMILLKYLNFFFVSFVVNKFYNFHLNFLEVVCFSLGLLKIIILKNFRNVGQPPIKIVFQKIK